MKDKIGQLLSIGIQGTELTSDEADFIAGNNIGGVTLFGRNLESPEQIHKLCTDIHNLKNRLPEKAPIYIGIDMEGGRVHRLKAPYTQWPALGKLGALDSTSMAFRFALNMGAELRASGISLDFAPCVDLNTNPDNPIIGDRSLSDDPEQVAKIASALVRGYIKSGIIPCAKHFPGHGNTKVDSHLDLPVEDTDRETLMNREIVPFKKTFRARLDLVMTAHIKFPQIDPEWPVTLSKIFLTDILREELRYRNLIMSDDLDMKALTNNYEKDMIAVRALQAGCDILLYCNEPESPFIALDAINKAIEAGELETAKLEESYSKVMSMKKARLADFAPTTFKDATNVIGHPDHLKLAKAINDGQILEEAQST